MVVTAGVLGIGLGACKDDGGGDGGGTTGSADGGTDDGDGADDDGDVDAGDADDGNCIAGGLGCACAEGVCSGVLFCVEDACVMGPRVVFEDEVPDVLAGLRVPLEVDAEGETIAWTQSAGPDVEFLTDTGTNVEINIPTSAGDGETITLEVEASLNGVTLSDSIDITIREAVFENVFPDVTDIEELGTTDGLAFNSNGMWVVSNEGFVSFMAPANNDGDKPVPASFVERHDVGGLPAGADFIDNDRLLIANGMLGEVQSLNVNSGAVETHLDQIDGGDPIGGVDVPLVLNDDGDFVVSNNVDGQIIFHDTGDADDDDPVPPSTFVLASAIGDNPNAIALGPEGQGLLYVGVLDAVVRVPYENGKLGEVSTYLDLAGMCGEVDGIVFDEGGNMWVGCPATNSLFVAQYAAGGGESTSVSRSWTDVGTGISRFANVDFGRDGFSGRALYWTNLEDGTVGVLAVGLGANN